MLKTGRLAVQLAAMLTVFLSVISELRAGEAKPYPTFGEIERVDPRFDKLIPPGAKLEKLAEGFEWSEGPVWVAEGEFLLFSDIPNNSVMKSAYETSQRSLFECSSCRRRLAIR